ncbi:MAG: hypothetical protein EBS01_05715 [Verrucomicrobia bacterium]|nr:hypothetical protein [Verrucomicrobiota bacterium]
MKTIIMLLVLVLVHGNPAGVAPGTNLGSGGRVPVAESLQSLDSVPPLLINHVRKESARKIRMRTYC